MYTGLNLFGSSLSDSRSLSPLSSAATVCLCVICGTGSYSPAFISRSGREYTLSDLTFIQKQ